MIIKKVALKNIKSFYPSVEVIFGDGINVLVGPNGGGKSNLLEVTQGVLFNNFFKWFSIVPNGEFGNILGQNNNFLYQYTTENPDIANQGIFFARHMHHSSELSSVSIRLQITRGDIRTFKYFFKNRLLLIDSLNDRVLHHEEIVKEISGLSFNGVLEDYLDREIELEFINSNHPGQISNLIEFNPDQHHLINILITVLRYLPSLAELDPSVLGFSFPAIGKYVSASRNYQISQFEQKVQLTGSNPFINTFNRTNRNQSKERAPQSAIEKSFVKIAWLAYVKGARSRTLRIYKKYLKEYLDIDLEVERVSPSVPNMIYYKVRFLRGGASLINISSGEKEYFNLITELILSEQKNGFIFIDEPELHLHARWQDGMLRLVNEIAKDFNTQFILVTHSSRFINLRTLGKVTRISKKADCSSISLANEVIETFRKKDLVRFLNIENSEKVFFTDKVFLVEGKSDEIVFEAIVDKIKKEYLQKGVIYLDAVFVPVGSKRDLLKVRKILKAWDVEAIIIADLDFIKDYSSQVSLANSFLNKEQITGIKEIAYRASIVSQTKLLKKLSEKGSKDGCSLLDIFMDSSTDFANQEVTAKLKDFQKYILNKCEVREMVGVVERAELELIYSLQDLENILILPRGELEDYFPELNRHDKVEGALEIAESISLDKVDRILLEFLKKQVIIFSKSGDMIDPTHLPVLTVS